MVFDRTIAADGIGVGACTVAYHTVGGLAFRYIGIISGVRRGCWRAVAGDPGFGVGNIPANFRRDSLD